MGVSYRIGAKPRAVEANLLTPRRRRSHHCRRSNDAYARRRCLLPIDNFFEWKAIKGQKAKQPYAIAMKSGEPFALAAIWERPATPGSDEWLRTFCILTTNAIHDRMSAIIPREAYDRWLANIEPDPRDILLPYRSELMTMWPISTRVNKPENNDASILEPVDPAQRQEDLLTIGRAPS
jgi:putative SOS response-associated peptidase YedK